MFSTEFSDQCCGEQYPHVMQCMRTHLKSVGAGVWHRMNCLHWIQFIQSIPGYSNS